MSTSSDTVSFQTRETVFWENFQWRFFRQKLFQGQALTENDRMFFFKSNQICKKCRDGILIKRRLKRNTKSFLVWRQSKYSAHPF